MNPPHPRPRRPTAARGSALAAALVALLTAGWAPATAAGGGLEPTTRWDPKLDALEAKIEAGKHGPAVRSGQRIVARMIGEAAGFEGSPRPLARALALLAFAEAGAGREREAAWHWHASRALDRRAAPREPARFGEAAARLAAQEVRRAGQAAAGAGSPPAARRQPYPVEQALEAAFDFSRYARGRVPPAVSIEVLVDREGRPHQPVLVTPSRYPGFASAALESVRDWRFEPARDADGGAVPGLAVLRIAYPFRR